MTSVCELREVFEPAKNRLEEKQRDDVVEVTVTLGGRRGRLSRPRGERVV